MKAELDQTPEDLPINRASLMIYDTVSSQHQEVGRLHPLSQAPQGVFIGYRTDSDIEFPLDESAPMNLRIHRDNDGAWLVENLELTSQLFVNDVLTKRRELRDGDRIQVGSTVLRFLDGEGQESQFHRRLHRLIGTDALTGVSNRRQLQQELLKSLAYCHRAGRDFCLVLLDFDNFSQVNNTYGHAAGDQVLREMTMRIRKNIRTEDIFGREGGEEFLIGLPSLAKEKAVAFMDRVRKKVTKDPILYKGESLKATFSAGLAEWERSSESATKKHKLEELAELTKLKQKADELMYQAKNRGKN